ncbi:MAG: TonB-dependent siderophore receptor [Opitutus sp.]|nr:TonB-dependent siderophore receptor [Opitutus sp.]
MTLRLPLFFSVFAATLAGAADTTSLPAKDEAIVLSAFEVSTKQDEGYRSNNSASGNKTGTAIRETPQSIQIVNQSFIDDLQARSVADALVYTSGLTEGQNSRGDRFEIRGFTTGIPFKNGFRDSGRAPRDTANFDRIEVAKGPASVIFSRTSAGGAVNILTKLPQRRRAVEVGATIGGNDFYRGTLDVTGPLSSEKLLYRVNVAWQDSGSYRDDGFIHKLFFTPVVSVILGPRTRLNVEFEYLRDQRVNDAGVVAVGNRVVRMPANTFYGDPDDVNSTWQYAGRYELLHTFASGLALRHAFRINETNEKGFDTQFNAVNANTLVMTRTRRWLAAEQVDNAYTQTEFSYELRGAGGRHKLLAGLEVGRNYDGGITNFAPLTATNVLNPVRGTTGTFVNNSWNDTTIWYDEYFVQDQFFCLEDKLTLVAGARLAHFASFATNKRTNVKTNTSGTSPNPRFGAVWLPRENVSVFANYSDIVANASNVNPDGSPLKPVKSSIKELGARVETLQRRLTVTGGYYELINFNTLNADPLRPGYRIETGKQRTRGIEFDFVGSLLPGWQIIGSANFTKGIVTRDLVNPVGNRLANTPARTFSVWNRYQFSEGSFKGLGAGFGVIAVGGRFGDVANTFYIPAYVRFDAALSYRTKTWDVSLNAQNLADKDYVRTTSGRLSIRPGSPRDFSLRFRQRL